jgi:hypothetical protein
MEWYIASWEIASYESQRDGLTLDATHTCELLVGPITISGTYILLYRDWPPSDVD